MHTLSISSFALLFQHNFSVAADSNDHEVLSLLWVGEQNKVCW